ALRLQGRRPEEFRNALEAQISSTAVTVAKASAVDCSWAEATLAKLASSSAPNDNTTVCKLTGWAFARIRPTAAAATYSSIITPDWPVASSA
ncbi:hypothetical protein SB847_20960, partial [Bacillus sp. SIMBA_026]